ncbi:alpha/beta fold hydrolase [Streptomyces sp. NPDC090106]|uniref:alpha/beta fold hydrolase n=1 Tax=Streptomyces sp. NPDC090106 TaxID=3365946 RepID=UPI0038274419
MAVLKGAVAMALTDEGVIRVDGFASRWVRLPGGVKAHYMTAGDEGPAVVLLHGGLMGSSGAAGWQHLAPELGRKGFRVYCPDLPSFGLTEDRTGYYEPGIQGHVDFVHDFTSALCLDRFHLAGNSAGCLATVQYVVAHPDRVLRFALIAGRVGDLVSMEEYIAVREETGFQPVQLAGIFDGTAESMEKLLRAITHRQGSISSDLLEMRTLAANTHQEAYGKHMEASFAAARGGDQDTNNAVRLSTKGRLDRITIPAIYLYGQDDVMQPVEDGYLQEKALPNIQFFYPANCGHQGQSDQPEIFTQVFAEFFGTGEVTRSTADRAGVSKNRPELHSVVQQV